ncbi:MAG: lipoprotein-releasing ABC transporter permease subunit [Gammaproteobacteria bacterium]
MFRPLSLFIGLRYTRAKRRNHFISFITGSSILGMALGITALITVLSVMNGFEKELRNRILGVSAHSTIGTNFKPLEDWQEVSALLAKQPNVEAAAPFIRSAAMATHDNRVNGTVVYGIDPDLESQVTILGDKAKGGADLSALKTDGGIILGSELAAKLKVVVGDRVTLVAPQPTDTPGEVSPELRAYAVRGTFKVGMYEYDSALALLNLADAQDLFKVGKAVSGIRLKFDDPMKSLERANQIVNGLGSNYFAIDWTQFHVNFFRALKSQKAMLFVIVTLIVAVAAFNIVSTLVMTVQDKRSDIAILRTLGLTPSSVMGVFVVQGVVIGLFGTVIGGACGLWLSAHIKAIAAWIERVTGFDLLPADVYFLSELPYDVHTADVMVVCFTAFMLSLLATLYPAWRAARTQPAEALRYE